jgi:hypothetical protein
MPPMKPAAAVCLGAKLVEVGAGPVCEAPEPVGAGVVLAAPPLPLPLAAVVVAALLAHETTEGTLTPLALQIWCAKETAALWSFLSQSVEGVARGG